MTEHLAEQWKTEEQAVFAGWDFSHLDGRYREQPLPWDYRTKVCDFLKPDTRLLDMDTGGGEILLSLRHPYALTSVTENYPPNLAYCRQRLEPLGIRVAAADEEGGLPFEENSFDLILNRHGDYKIEELRRVLKPGGFFITQQVGGSNNRPMSKLLCPGFVPPNPAHNLENEAPRFAGEGFRLLYQNQSYTRDTLTDVGALCYFAKQLPWEFPGFSVESALPQLMRLHKWSETHGEIPLLTHRFLLVVKNSK